MLNMQPSKIDIAVRTSMGDEVIIDNIIGVIYDRDACGIYQIDETVATSPLNSKGLYYNQHYHLKPGRFVDTSENCVLFTLN